MWACDPAAQKDSHSPGSPTCPLSPEVGDQTPGLEEPCLAQSLSRVLCAGEDFTLTTASCDSQYQRLLLERGNDDASSPQRRSAVAVIRVILCSISVTQGHIFL